MATRKQGEVPGVFSVHVGQEILDLQLERQARFGDANPAQRLAAVRVNEPRKVGVWGTHQNLGHAQLDVRPQEIEHDVEYPRMIDHIDERLANFQRVAVVHPSLGIVIGISRQMVFEELVDVTRNLGYLGRI